MIKKILGITLLLLFSSALIYGGIYRTQALSGGESGSDRETTAVQNGANGTSGQTLVEPAPEEHIWLTVQGTVMDIDRSHLLLQTETGTQIEIAGRAWDFARQSGFTAKNGDNLELTGFDENGEFKMGVIENPRSGQRVQVRGEDGRPLWAGRGQGSH